MKGILKFVLITVCITGITACDKQGTATPFSVSHHSEVIAVNNPLYFFTSELAAELVAVSLIAPAGIDPAEWTPTIEDILRMQQAELIILNGAGYSNWLDRVALSHSKQVDTSSSFESELIPLEQETTHSHGPVAEHSHSGYALTTWMDPVLARSQVHAITLALIKRWPNAEEDIVRRETLLNQKLEMLDLSYRRETAKLEGKTIIYSHPVYQYFDRRYQLNGHALHWEPDEQPTVDQWSELTKIVGASEDILFIWEDFPLESVISRLHEMNIETAVIRPAAGESQLDWAGEQQRNIDRLIACCPDARPASGG